MFLKSFLNAFVFLRGNIKDILGIPRGSSSDVEEENQVTKRRKTAETNENCSSIIVEDSTEGGVGNRMVRGMANTSRRAERKALNKVDKKKASIEELEALVPLIAGKVLTALKKWWDTTTLNEQPTCNNVKVNVEKGRLVAAAQCLVCHEYRNLSIIDDSRVSLHNFIRHASTHAMNPTNNGGEATVSKNVFPDPRPKPKLLTSYFKRIEKLSSPASSTQTVADTENIPETIIIPDSAPGANEIDIEGNSFAEALDDDVIMLNVGETCYESEDERCYSNEVIGLVDKNQSNNDENNASLANRDENDLASSAVSNDFTDGSSALTTSPLISKN